MSSTFVPADPAKEAGLRNITLIVHLLYASSLFLGVTGLVGVVVAYMKRADAAGTIYESHMTYAIRTFLLGLIVLALMVLLIGVLLASPVAIWYVVRLVRPILRWADNKPIANPTGFF